MLATDATSSEILEEVFDGLLRLDPRSGQMEPALAERWEISPDGTEVTLFLRRDVRWHDGTPFTAADVVFTFDAIYDPSVPTSLKNTLTIDGQRIGVTALDDHTVRLKLPHAFAPLLNAIAAPIVPKHRLGAALAAGERQEARDDLLHLDGDVVGVHEEGAQGGLVVRPLAPDLGEAPQLGDRSPQLVREVARESPFALECLLEAVEEVVQLVHERN